MMRLLVIVGSSTKERERDKRLWSECAEQRVGCRHRKGRAAAERLLLLIIKHCEVPDQCLCLVSEVNLRTCYSRLLFPHGFN